MSKLPEEFLKHILDEIVYLINTSENLDELYFARNETLQRAFARSLEIIGEASKNLPSEYKQTNNEVDWKSVAGMRDKLIHHYFGVDYEIVWDVVKNEIPKLKLDIEKLIEVK
mgnify:FL=1